MNRYEIFNLQLLYIDGYKISNTWKDCFIWEFYSKYVIVQCNGEHFPLHNFVYVLMAICDCDFGSIYVAIWQWIFCEYSIIFCFLKSFVCLFIIPFYQL